MKVQIGGWASSLSFLHQWLKIAVPLVLKMPRRQPLAIGFILNPAIETTEGPEITEF